MILRKGRHLDQVSATERHKVRIAAKKLRYASEFFRTLVRGKRAGRDHDAFIKGLEQLQETLGALNDIHTGQETAEQIAHATKAEGANYAFSAGLVTGEQQAEGDDLILSAVAAYNALSNSKSPLAKAS
jgi:CHAD domain-containing protein